MSAKQPKESYVGTDITDQVMTAINLLNAGLQHPVVVARLERVLRPRNVKVMQMHNEQPHVHLISNANAPTGVQCFYEVSTQEDVMPSWFRIMTQKGSWVFEVKWDDSHQFTISLESES